MKTISSCENEKNGMLEMSIKRVVSAIVYAITHSPLRSIPSQVWEFAIRLVVTVCTERQTIFEAVRKYCLYFLVVIATGNTVFGKIKNGYEKNIDNFRKSCKNLYTILNETESISLAQRRKIESQIDIIQDNISYHELTESLLNQFRRVSPGLYDEIDTITDHLGRPVDVYVKFVPVDATEVKAKGTTYISQIENDKDGYQSEYGEFTVSVKIWIANKALLILAHEFGHVKYQVPNLASYVEFHKSTYDMTDDINFVGHNTDDPSGKSAVRFGRIFWKDFLHFSKTTDEKLLNPFALLARIKKTMVSHANIL